MQATETTTNGGENVAAAFAGGARRTSVASTLRIANLGWLALPSLGFVAILFLWPMVRLFLESVAFPDWSLANYVTFFTQGGYLRVLVRTVEAGVLVTGVCLLLGYPLAYAIHASRGAIRSAMLLLVVMPYLTSLLVRTYAWIVILGDGGVVNQTLLAIGLIDQPLRILYTSVAAYIGMIHIMLPLMVLPILSVMQGVDRRLVGAAMSMGAGPIECFVRIFLPLTASGIKSGCVLVFILSIGFYITPAALGGLSDALLSQLIEVQLSQAVNFGLAASASLVLLVVAGICIMLFGLDFTAAQTGVAYGGAGKTARKAAPLARAVSTLAAGLATFPVAQRVLDMRRRRRQRVWRATQARPDPMTRLRPGILFGYGTLMLALLILPNIIVIVMSFSSEQFLSFPPPDFSLRWYRHFLSDETWTDALWSSLQIATASTLLSCLIGVLAAFAVSRKPGLGRFVMPILLSPIIVPIVVVGVALYVGFSSWGLVGTKPGLILAHTLGGIGYVVIIVSATLVGFDQRLERAALSLGASPLRTVRKVTLPLIVSGIVAGAIFAFIHSFDEVVIATFLGGYDQKTLPMKMWEDIRHQIDPTIAAVSSVLMVLPALWLVILQVSKRRRGQSRTGAI